MKKILTVQFDGNWVLSRRGDALLPVDLIKGELLSIDGFSLMDQTFDRISFSFEGNILSASEAEDKISKLLSAAYEGEEAGKIFSVELGDYAEEQPEKKEDGAAEEEQKRSAPRAFSMRPGRGEDISAVKKEAERLIGAVQFKGLLKELEEVAPLLASSGTGEVFLNRSYLFSIGDGCGLSTYLEILGRYITALGLAKVADETEVRLSRSENDPFDAAYSALNRINRPGEYRIVCIDISEWMDETSSSAFRQFMRTVEKSAAGNIIVFRIPFVDKDVLSRVGFALGDVLSITPVAFPPLSAEELKGCAKAELERLGFSLSQNAWSCFFERIAEEKSDGRFYGINTVRKVVRELVYQKQLKNARLNKNEAVIGQKEAALICSVNPAKGGKSAMEELKSLVGSEGIVARVNEIIAQIELALRSEEDRPCLHMRFVGNPGTGKTTVARLLGRILKEKGVLRVGNFYEYKGRDFCGRYVGETAPKTSAICRDAYGSVLFIDEAYSLYRGDADSRDYGREALDTLIAEMENHRSDFVVIMAGYTDDMEVMMQGNAGLASRMPYTLEFPNFTREELYQIFEKQAETRYKLKYDKSLLSAAEQYFLNLPESLMQAKEFSNARYVRNLFERTCGKAALRCQLEGKKEVILTKEDFEHATADREFAFNEPRKTTIGFNI